LPRRLAGRAERIRPSLLGDTPDVFVRVVQAVNAAERLAPCYFQRNASGEDFRSGRSAGSTVV